MKNLINKSFNDNLNQSLNLISKDLIFSCFQHRFSNIVQFLQHKLLKISCCLQRKFSMFELIGLKKIHSCLSGKVLFVFSISIWLCLITGISVAVTENLDTTNFATRPVVQDFIQQMHLKHNLELSKLQQLFQNYSTMPEVLAKISNPAEKLSWGKYQQLLISPDRIAKGKKFLIQHQQALVKAERTYGVPKELIAAIIGVESFYGEKTGTIPVVGALATLAFDYPPRSKFFKQELEQLLLLMQEENLDLATINGSYAGAVSPAQFIPSSYRNYAVDFSNSGSKDLMKMENAIGSIGNYLRKHGWQAKQPVATLVKVANQHKNYIKYIEQDLSNPKPKHLLTQLQASGVITKKSVPNGTSHHKAALIELINDTEKHSKQYWLGFENFYVITRYNHSTNYAMAVYQLAVKLGMG